MNNPVLKRITAASRLACGCLGLLILLFSQAALAFCYIDGWMNKDVAISTIPNTITLSRAQSASPINTPISDWYSLTSNTVVYCPHTINELIRPAYVTLTQRPYTASSSGSYSENGLNFTVYNTQVAGIGYIIQTSGTVTRDLIISPTALSGSSAQTLAGTTFTGTLDNTIDLTVSVKFIKTTNLPAASYTLPKTILAYYAVVTGSQTATGSVSMNGSTVSVPAPTCSVNTQNIPVSLPGINTAVLPTLNATAGRTPFNIVLNCPASNNVYMTLTDNTNPGRTTSIIGLAPNGSTASGVGIQIIRNGSPVLLGPDSSAAGNTNQFAIGQNQLGTITIPLSAEYIRIGTVQGGQVKAVATFTMSYQ